MLSDRRSISGDPSDEEVKPVLRRVEFLALCFEGKRNGTLFVLDTLPLDESMNGIGAVREQIVYNGMLKLWQ